MYLRIPVMSFPLALSTPAARMVKLELSCLTSRTPCSYWRGTRRM